jgi:hypothetical protein
MRHLLFTLIVILPWTVAAQSGRASSRPLYDKKTVGEIRLNLPVARWVDALDSMRLYGTDLLTGSATIDKVKYDGVGVRFRGDKSYQLGVKRNPFTVVLNHTNPEQNHQGYTQLKLSSALRDPSMVRELLFLEVAGKYIPVPEANYTKLFVNEEYIGVFVNLESVDRNFAQKRFGSSPTGNAFFKAGVDHKPAVPATCRQNIYGSLEYEENLACFKGNFEMEGPYDGWNELQELTRILNQEPQNLERILDIDQALWMLALDNVMVNLSSYIGSHSTNYYLYKDRNGRFQVVPWDLNLAFGSFKNTGQGSDLELKELQNLSPLLHADNPYKPLASQLLKDPFYRKVYLSHVRQIVEENFANGAYAKRAKELQAMIVVPFDSDKNKVYSLDEFKRSLNETIGKRSRIPGIVELMDRRTQFLKKHPELTALPSVVSDVRVQSRGKFENQPINAFRISARADRFPQRLLLYYRFSPEERYTPVVLTEEPSNDLPSGVKSYITHIDAKSPDDVLDYYIVAENAGTVSFLPTAYPSKPSKVKLSDLNK